eukprot:4417903-Pyramimonas_sp.AAC.1
MESMLQHTIASHSTAQHITAVASPTTAQCSIAYDGETQHGIMQHWAAASRSIRSLDDLRTPQHGVAEHH